MGHKIAAEFLEKLIMAVKRTRYSAKTLFVWCFLSGFVLLLLPASLTSCLQGSFARVFRTPLRVGRNIELFKPVKADRRGFVSRTDYIRLQNHAATLESQLEAERHKLALVSGIKERLAFAATSLIPADVVTVSIGPLQGQMILNRGANDGIEKGNYVIASNSVIGRVTDVWANQSAVRMVTDPLSQVPARIAGADVNILLKGGGENCAVIDFLKVDFPIAVGANVCARPQPEFLEAPIVIGRVSHCSRDEENPLIWDIIVTPACEFSDVTTVAVLKVNKN